MKARTALAWILRESRGARGRLVFFTACLAIGTGAISGVGSLGAAVEAALRSGSRELLGADVRVESRRPLPAELDAFLAERPEIERTDAKVLLAMAGAHDGDGGIGATRLVEIKAVDGRFPLHGALELDRPGTLADHLGPQAAVVAPEVTAALGRGVGEAIAIGGARFEIAATVLAEPDRLDAFSTLGPRVFLSAEGLARTELSDQASRRENQALLLFPRDLTRDEMGDFERELADALPAAQRVSVETHFEAQPAVRRALRRFESYAGLVALLSLLLGGVGVAQVVRSMLAGRSTAIAVLRAIGLRPRDVALLQLGQVALLASVASAIGAALGALVPLAVPRLAPDLLPAGALRLGQPEPIARALLLGVGVAIVFALGPLCAVWRVSPARVLRSEAAPLPAPRAVRLASFLALAAGMLVAARLQSGEWDLACAFTGGLVALAALLFGGARLLVRLAGRVPRARPAPPPRHGNAALARPGAGTVGAIVALGLGVLVVAGMALVEGRLHDELEGALPADAPTAFLIDVQPSQWERVRAALEGAGATTIDSVPLLPTRIAAIDGEPVERIAERRKAQRRNRWALTREQRLTWHEELHPSNRLVAGELWSEPDVAEISLEERFADGIDAELGTRITFDVAGVPFEFLVTSLRDVEWRSFAINFFCVVEPGHLEKAPHTRVAAARLPADREEELQSVLLAEFPNVTLLRVRPILERALEILDRLAFAVRALGGFTAAVGLAILCGAVAASTLRRAREAALLKTLGLTRRGVALFFGVEFAAVGAVAGAIGGLGGTVLAFAFVEYVLELEGEVDLVAVPVAAAVAALLSAFAGLAASARALAAPPLVHLRGTD